MDIDVPAIGPIDTIDELILILIFSGSSIYVLFEASSFPSSAALWPELLSVCILVGIVLITTQNYLPNALREIVSGSVDLVDEDIGDSDQEKTDNEGESGMSTVNRPIHDSLFTVLSSIGYIVVGFLFGLLWATPIFVAIYTIWFRLKWYFILGLPLLTFGIAYVFMTFMYLPLDSGAFFGGL